MYFLNPWFLLGFLAILIPIAIHLFTFRRYKKEYFSNVRLLKELQIETKKQSQIRHWLILALRILSIIFLVLAFAQPFIANNRSQKQEKGQAMVSIYIDNSFSMQNVSQNGSLLNEAKQRAREIINSHKPNDRFQLLNNNLDGKHHRFVGKDEVLTYLDEMDFSSASPSLSNIVSKQYDLLHSQNKENRYCYLISDFQKSTADFESFKKDSTVNTFLIPLTAPKVANLYIDSLWFASPVFLKGTQQNVFVQIVNTGTEALEKIPVKLFINGKEKSLSGLDIGAGEKKTVTLPFSIESSGILQASVKINDYPIVFDDEIFFSLLVNKQISILAINGKEDNKYLKYLFGNDSAFAYQSVFEKDIDYNKLNTYNFIILNELPALHSGLAQALSGFVDEGGSLLIIPPAQLTESNYKAALQTWGIPYFGNSDTTTTKGSWINTNSVLYNRVFESVPKNMEYPIISSHYKLMSQSNTNKESLLKLEMGDDFITQSEKNKGKIYLLASPAQEKASNFVKHPLFVPTLFNMALYSQTQNKLYYTIGINEPINVSNLKHSQNNLFRITEAKNELEFIPEIRSSGTQQLLFVHNQATIADNYLLFEGEDALCGLSFNYNRKESDMQTFNYEELESVVEKAQLPNTQVVKVTEKPLQQTLQKERIGTQLWKYFVLLALASLLAEVLLLRFFHRKKAQ